MKKIFIALAAIVLILLVVFYLFNRQAYFSHGRNSNPQTFEVKGGEGVQTIASKLETQGLISHNLYFDYYVWRTGSKSKIQAGKYELRGSMTIPEIVQVLSIGEIVSNEAKVTFPEGITVKAMADILKKKGFDGDGFLNSISSGTGVKTSYDFLKDRPAKVDLEGYLFPDTYIFFKDAKPEDIANRMLLNFDEKLTPKMREDIQSQGKDINQIVTMASIIEKEVKTPDDMKIVSGIFWDRIGVGMPLQSCATISYVLGEDKKQFSYDDTRTPSPYNTYINKGLPPGPISNPGLNSLVAAIYPTKTDYNYFLSDPSTGQTIFSKTIEEHNANKTKYGL